uniref:cell division protein PerM n=1 Tax=Haloactinospora alba TaxID=405555 RepID=UPI0037423E74
MSAPPRQSTTRGSKAGHGDRTTGRADRAATPAAGGDSRPLYTAGGFAAASAAGVGLAVLTTFTVLGWVAAPHGTIGEDILDVLRTAVQAWLVGHLVGVGIPGGSVSLLPLGLLVLPGLLLFRAGRWLARTCDLPRLRHMFRAAVAISGPYAAICGTLALAVRTESMRPSLLQALVAGFALAFVAGGLGALRQLMKDNRIPRRRLLAQIPDRYRPLLVGTLGSTATLLAVGLLLFGAGLAAGAPEAADITGELAPGAVGGTLLVLAQLLYLPNAVVFGLSYATGPGFTMGTDTAVAPSGVSVGELPMFPMLAALPDNGPAPVVSLAAVAGPFVAGAVGGTLAQRSAPEVVAGTSPLWGLATGATTGMMCAVLAGVAGGSLGGQRLAAIGPSAWQVGLAAAAEVGAAAAVAVWVATWWRFRPVRPRTRRTPAGAAEAADTTADAQDARPVPATAEPEPAGEAPADADQPKEETGAPRAGEGTRRRAWLGRLRVPRLRFRRDRDAGDDRDGAEDDLFGITYEAGAEDGTQR